MTVHFLKKPVTNKSFFCSMIFKNYYLSGIISLSSFIWIEISQLLLCIFSIANIVICTLINHFLDTSWWIFIKQYRSLNIFDLCKHFPLKIQVKMSQRKTYINTCGPEFSTFAILEMKTKPRRHSPLYTSFFPWKDFT